MSTEKAYLEWTDDDQERAKVEGWGVFTSDDGDRIERWDLSKRFFENDAGAVCHVYDMARLGSHLHRKAMLITLRPHKREEVVDAAS